MYSFVRIFVLLAAVQIAASADANEAPYALRDTVYASYSAAAPWNNDERKTDPGSHVEKGFRGSTPIKVSQTVHTGRWSVIMAEDKHRYFQDGCNGPICTTPAHAKLLSALESSRVLPLQGRVAAINIAVNRTISYVTDEQQYGLRDHWASATETLASGRGDCEDNAIVKMWMLRAIGIPPHDIQLLLVRDERRRLDHAILVVQINGSSYVLDNVHDRLVPEMNAADYRALVSLGSADAWIHGYTSRPTRVSGIGRH